jgi:hypothetical protein
MLRELEDFTWFPAELRRQQTAFIGWMVRLFKVYDFLIPILEKECVPHRGVITDLGSGNGGPWLSLANDTRLAGCNILLTDLFPQVPEKLPQNCIYERISVSTLSSLPTASGLVTMFNAFHHFNPQERKDIVKQLLLNGRSFMACEILRPNALDFIRIILATTLGQLILAPFVMPFSWKRLFFTYILPVNIITVTWDGVISVIKSLNNREWQSLVETTAELGGSAKIIRKESIFVHTTCFICHLPMPGRP